GGVLVSRAAVCGLCRAQAAARTISHARKIRRPGSATRDARACQVGIRDRGDAEPHPARFSPLPLWERVVRAEGEDRVRGRYLFERTTPHPARLRSARLATLSHVQVGCFRLGPIMEWPNLGTPGFGVGEGFPSMPLSGLQRCTRPSITWMRARLRLGPGFWARASCRVSWRRRRA